MAKKATQLKKTAIKSKFTLGVQPKKVSVSAVKSSSVERSAALTIKKVKSNISASKIPKHKTNFSPARCKGVKGGCGGYGMVPFGESLCSLCVDL